MFFSNLIEYQTLSGYSPVPKRQLLWRLVLRCTNAFTWRKRWSFINGNNWWSWISRNPVLCWNYPQDHSPSGRSDVSVASLLVFLLFPPCAQSGVISFLLMLFTPRSYGLSEPPCLMSNPGKHLAKALHRSAGQEDTTHNRERWRKTGCIIPTKRFSWLPPRHAYPNISSAKR